MNNKLGTIALCAVALCGVALTTQSKAAFADETTVVTHTYNNGQPSSGGPIRVMLNGTRVDFNGPGPVMMDGGYVFVPIRGVFEQMGGDVQWHEDSQTIDGAKPGHMFRIRVGSTDAVVNGDHLTLAAPPQLIGGTTYVPLRLASESLGAHVRWDQDRNTVFIRTGDSDDADADGTVRTLHRRMHDGTGDDNDQPGTTTTIIKKTTTP
jgi:hypothetical protein